MFEFDRQGTDVVMYDYEHPDYEAMLEPHGFSTGWGSYSDICHLSHLDITGFNFGCGYYQNHQPGSHFVVQEAHDAVEKFLGFYDEYKDTLMPKKESARRYSRYSSYGSYSYARGMDDVTSPGIYSPDGWQNSCGGTFADDEGKIITAEEYFGKYREAGDYMDRATGKDAFDAMFENMTDNQDKEGYGQSEFNFDDNPEDTHFITDSDDDVWVYDPVIRDYRVASPHELVDDSFHFDSYHGDGQRG